MTKNEFLQLLQQEAASMQKAVSTPNGDWIVKGNGLFSTLGESVFDDYWMFYLTGDMARAAELPAPYYKNIGEYKKFKGI